jgi:hypothetical protein
MNTTIPKNVVVLKGGPYKNSKTVKALLKSCIPELTRIQASRLVEKANRDSFVSIILQDPFAASRSCSCLIENGLYASLEEAD